MTKREFNEKVGRHNLIFKKCKNFCHWGTFTRINDLAQLITNLILTGLMESNEMGSEKLQSADIHMPQNLEVTHTLVAAKSKVTFSVKSWFYKLKGLFPRFRARVSFSPHVPEDSQVTLTIESRHVDAYNLSWDKELRNKAFLDTENYPVIEFQTRSMQYIGSVLDVKGQLTMKGVTAEIQFPVTVSYEEDAGEQQLVLSGDIELLRQQFRLGGKSIFWSDKVVIGFKLVLRPVGKA